MDDDLAWYDSFYQLSHKGARFEYCTYTLSDYFDVDRYLGALDREKCQLDILDTSNLWIVKPGAMSRGRGITIQTKLSEILQCCQSTSESNGRWVVQKYIERPLLMNNYKFDIRQWFVVDGWNPLRIWMYKDAYLRFGAKKYSTTDMSRVRHVCNYAVQVKHTSAPEIWSNDQFEAWYFTKFNIPNVWTAQVWPQIVDIVTYVMLSALESGDMEAAVDMSKSFELYGGDFMLTADESGKIKVWLAEINSCPLMQVNASCDVFGELCRNVLEDTLDLVISPVRRNFITGDHVGRLELAYKHEKYDAVDAHVFDAMAPDLTITGSKLLKPRRRRTISVVSPANSTPKTTPKASPRVMEKPCRPSETKTELRAACKTIVARLQELAIVKGEGRPSSSNDIYKTRTLGGFRSPCGGRGGPVTQQRTLYSARTSKSLGSVAKLTPPTALSAGGFRKDTADSASKRSSGISIAELSLYEHHKTILSEPPNVELLIPTAKPGDTRIPKSNNSPCHSPRSSTLLSPPVVNLGSALGFQHEARTIPVKKTKVHSNMWRPEK